MDPVALGFKDVPSDDQVDQQVAVEHQRVVKEDAVERGVQENVYATHRLTKVDQDEQHAHDQRCNGQELARMVTRP